MAKSRKSRTKRRPQTQVMDANQILVSTFLEQNRNQGAMPFYMAEGFLVARLLEPYTSLEGFQSLIEPIIDIKSFEWDSKEQLNEFLNAFQSYYNSLIQKIEDLEYQHPVEKTMSAKFTKPLEQNHPAYLWSIGFNTGSDEYFEYITDQEEDWEHEEEFAYKEVLSAFYLLGFYGQPKEEQHEFKANTGKGLLNEIRADGDFTSSKDEALMDLFILASAKSSLEILAELREYLRGYEP